MAQISFDDLIPKDKASSPPPVSFDDLIPPPKMETLPQYDAMGNPTGGTETVIAKPETTYAEQMLPIAKGLPSIGHSLASGATLGLSDQAIAGARAALGNAPPLTLQQIASGEKLPSAYERALAQERESSNRFGPISTGLQGAGMALTGAALAPYSLGARAVSSGARLIPRVAGFGTDAGILGAISGAGHTDSTNPSDYLVNAAKEGAIAGTVGTVLPLAGAGLGAGYRTIANALERAPGGLNKKAAGLLAENLPPEAVAGLRQLGPDAIAADASPGAQTLLQRLATGTDATGLNVTRALEARQAAAPTRLASDLDATIGPSTSPMSLEQSMRDRMAENSPAYRAVHANAPAVDTTNTQAEIGRLLTEAAPGTPEYNAIARYRNIIAPYEEQLGRTIPVTDSRRLHQIRRTLDDAIEYGDAAAGLSSSAARAEGSPLNVIRRTLDRDLKDQVPGMAEADLAHHTAAEGLRSLEVGRKALKGGENAIWPQELSARLANQPLEQQALERAGAASYIRGEFGTKPNDPATLRKIVGDPNDFNRAKLEAYFGPEAANRLAAATEREQRFAQTASQALGGARTDLQRRAGEALEAATEARKIKLPAANSTLYGTLARGGVGLANKALGLLSTESGEAIRNSLARVLLMPAGPERDAFLQRLLEYQARRAGRGSALTGILSSRAPVRGILGYENQAGTQ